MKIAYYPGCSLHATAIEYDMSTQKVCDVLGIELAELKDWICCGASSAHQKDELMSVALPAKNLAMVERTGAGKSVCMPCAACYSRMKFAQHEMADEKVKRDVEHVIDGKCPEDIEVIHLLDMFVEKVGIEAIKSKVVKKLSGIKTACYYGCLITRPPKVTGVKDYENPTNMEAVLEAIGVETVDWNLKTFCCGAGFALTQTDVVLDLTQKILADAAASGAEMISVGCPLCHVNLDSRQQQINKKFGTNFNVPIFYFTELMALAMGVGAKDLGLGKHLTDVEGFLKERAIL